MSRTRPPSQPTRLRVEHLDEPLGINAGHPRLSWSLPAETQTQFAYRIRAGAWDPGRVESTRSQLVPYEGPELASGQRMTWAVKVWTDVGESDWSEPAWWEMGLLDADDWTASWIEAPARASSDDCRPRPAQLFRHRFKVEGSIARARLYATAHGIYELFLNGHRVGDMELTPGCTSYRSRLQVQTFDVTGLLEPGENVVGAVVSDGWYCGQSGGGRVSRVHGERVALLAQLHIYGHDGPLTRIGTGPDWTTGTGSILAADLMEGQLVDFRRDLPGWSSAAAPDGWADAVVRDYDVTRLCSSPAPPVRRIEHLRPVSVTRNRLGHHIVDLGQNINGWIRLTNLGLAGTTLTLTHGEVLGADADLTLTNLVCDEKPGTALWENSNKARPFQVDRVTSAGDASQCFEPRHTTHGFRYVRIEGYPGELSANDISGVVVHTDLRRTGWFECSDERINRLHEAAVWSFRSNACDIPSDCPTRERAGWTGDWQIFVAAAAFLYDVAGFSIKWLRDLAAEQRHDGAVLHCAPDPHPTQFTNSAANPWPPGSAGYGDAAVIVPREIYRAYGDERVLEEQWASMTGWVDYAARVAREHRHPSRVAARPTPAPHEAFIWDTGFHWGEWLEPGQTQVSPDDLAAADHGDLATAYLHNSARLLAEMAPILGRDNDLVRYRDLAAATKAAWQAEFISSEGKLARDTQAAYARALAFDLVPDTLRPQFAERLVELIRAAETHVGTGFLATPYLLPVLADVDYLDVAYQLLLQDTEPSWLTMIDRGATTVWEHWRALDDHGVPSAPPGVGSLNHYSKGAVISFLHRYVAGIRLGDEPGYREFHIAPEPGGGITWARAQHDSPYGRIEASWRLDADDFILDVRVPAGTRAEVWLPDGQRLNARPGTGSYRCKMRGQRLVSEETTRR